VPSEALSGPSSFPGLCVPFYPLLELTRLAKFYQPNRVGRFWLRPSSISFRVSPRNRKCSPIQPNQLVTQLIEHPSLAFRPPSEFFLSGHCQACPAFGKVRLGRLLWASVPFSTFGIGSLLYQGFACPVCSAFRVWPPS
jgi:hypothetical protein